MCTPDSGPAPITARVTVLNQLAGIGGGGVPELSDPRARFSLLEGSSVTLRAFANCGRLGMSGVDIMWRRADRASREDTLPGGLRLDFEVRSCRKGGEREEYVEEDAAELASEVSIAGAKSRRFGVGVVGCHGSVSSSFVVRNFPLSSSN